MVRKNCTWGEERIAAELCLMLGLTVSPRTVRRYMPPRPRSRGGRSTQTWATFLRNRAGAVLACDFFIAVTATFQGRYVFVILDIGTRRVVHWNLTDHPTAEWTVQQFRDGLPLDGDYRFLFQPECVSRRRSSPRELRRRCALRGSAFADCRHCRHVGAWQQCQNGCRDIGSAFTVVDRRLSEILRANGIRHRRISPERKYLQDVSIDGGVMIARRREDRGARQRHRFHGNVVSR